MDKRVPVKTIYLLSIISIGLIGLAVGSTFAMFEASSTINNPISLSSTLTYSDDVLQTINVSLDPEEEKELTLNITNSTTSTMYYSAWYLNEGQNIDFATDDDTTGTIAGVTSETLTITIRNNTSRTINVTIGVSTSNENNVVLDTGMVLIPKQAMPSVGSKLTNYITRLYMKAPKKVVTNYNVEYNLSDDTGKSGTEIVGLMSDRLGSMSVNADDGNIRYYGATPNNYVYFNCDDYDNQNDSTCELWRIVGVFNTTDENGVTSKRVKIVKNDSIGSFSWDTASTTEVANGAGISQWGESTYTDDSAYKGADLMRLLNPNYDSYTGPNKAGTIISVNNSLYWRREAGNCYNNTNNNAVACDFTTTGLKNNTRTMISSVDWNMGVLSSSMASVDSIYIAERSNTTISNPNDGVARTTIWNGKVALLYLSDYMYAADLTSCSAGYVYYNNCSSVNWMFGMQNGNAISLLPVYKMNETNGVLIKTVKNTGGGNNDWPGSGRQIHPTVYLNKDVKLSGGEGTSINPYQIK